MGTTHPVSFIAVALACWTPAGCADDHAAAIDKITPGVTSVTVQIQPLNVPGLVLKTATLHLSHVAALGNTPPPPPMGPPPPRGMHPSSMTDLDLDVLSAEPSTAVLPELPQGLYSRVEFFVGDVVLAGSWRGATLHAQLAMVMHKRVDLRAATARELGPNQNAAFTVALDPNGWFAGDLLDTAAAPQGQILCDDQNNPEVAAEVTTRILHSFALP